MNHWIIAPVLLPGPDCGLYHPVGGTLSDRLAAGAVGRGNSDGAGSGHRSADPQRSGAIDVYELGNWPAPFGIVLVLDRLSAMMVLLTAVLALGVVLYAIGTGWDKRGHHFHALFQFQLMGIIGAFLTGDAFNLFVFFEVLLIASYGLMIHGGGATRLRAGVQYVIYNLLGPTLFLFALGHDLRGHRHAEHGRSGVCVCCELPAG
jgi:multicomponent K+:H+ antiporter subunit D